MQNLHQKLTQKYHFYHNWHQTKHHNKVHWGALAVFTFFVFGMMLYWTPMSFAAPTTPTNLTAITISSSQINLSWTASTDTGGSGLAGYKIYRCAGSACAPTTLIATSAIASYSDTGLTASTTYTYAVSAFDDAGNGSAQSSLVSAITLRGPLRSNGSPTGILRGTTGERVDLSLTTNESATCRYGTSPGITYASMVNTFTQTSGFYGGFYHKALLWNLTAGTHTYYIRCSGSSGENTDDYVVNFAVIDDMTPDAPSHIIVNSVAGVATDGALLTIQGSGFGTISPSVLLFDDFEGGSPGSDIPVNSPKVGSWSGAGTNPPTYSTTSFSGQFAMQIRDASDMQQFNKTFPQPVQELYISYWVRIPDGTNFPGAGGPNILPDASTWKLTWIFNGPSGYGSPNNDLILPAWPGGSFSLTGNDHHLAYLGKSFWTFNRYMRISTWIKANGTDPLLPGDVRFNVFQDGIGLVRRMERTDIALFDADDPTPADGDYYCTHEGNGTQWCQAGQPKQWDRITVPGWLLSNGDWRRPLSGDPALEVPIYDDFYMATGPGAQARVEIGDMPTYSSNTRVTIATPESWSDTAVTARFQSGNMSQGLAYLYVIDADGKVNTNGYPITIGSTPDTQSPTNLTATAISSSQINLSWTASTDNVGVTGYKIYRCAGSTCAPTVQVATSTTNSYLNTGLAVGTVYTYAVSAYDFAENESEKSSPPVSATTLADFKPSDLNQDTKVDQQDFDILKQNWNRTDKPPSDINQDGIVDSRDLGIMMSNWEN